MPRKTAQEKAAQEQAAQEQAAQEPAGQGKTAGRGTKGQKARTGGAKGPYFEGGQLPLVRRLPFKRGFNNIFRIEYQEVSIKKLADAFKSGANVTPQTLKDRRLISD